MSNEISNPNRVLTKEGLSWLWGKIKALVSASAYTLPPATTSTLGGVKAGSSVNVASDGTITVPSMSGATSSVDGGAGLVPAPLIADTDHFLACDGTWKAGGKPMVILSYGSSVWNDFIEAYNNHVIVYCRASSNSNPASGSQTRMAFMAYVNNATTPTEVEFQYYRSVSSHSATQMGDQVFVYKLTNKNAWTVTTREASIKTISAASGSKIGVSWSNNAVTLSNTMTASDMPMSSSDSTVVSAALDEKADKVSGATTGNLASLDSNGNLVDSGSKASDFLTQHQDISGKADKVQNATTGNFAGLDANGNLTDSGHSNSDYIPSSQKGSASGVAELDANGHVPSSQLPSYVDDVVEYDTLSEFPATGESGKIYIAKDTNITYRWGGSSYVAIGSDLALGETSSTAYRGDRGKTAYDHATDSSRVTTATSSGLYKISITNEGHVGSATAVVKSDITDLGIPGSAEEIISEIPTMTGATASEDGVEGFVPAPTTADKDKFLRGDGTWADTDCISKYYDVNVSSWNTKTWNGLTEFYGSNIWTDGNDIYYSFSTSHYMLNRSTSTWDIKTWNGLSSFSGENIWTDGTNIYYSSGSNQYVLDKTTSTWSAKTWAGLSSFDGYEVWTGGDEIYYSGGGEFKQYVLNKTTSTWNEKSWNMQPLPSSIGIFFLDALNIWTDGTDYYYNYHSDHYVLDKTTSTWNAKTWYGIDEVSNFLPRNIWTDGINIYYSSDSYQCILDKATSTWKPKTWDEFSPYAGAYVWKDGEQYYYNDASRSYVLIGPPQNLILVGNRGQFDSVNAEEYFSEIVGDFKGSTSTVPGTHGLVPAPTISDKEKFLCGDGSWAIPDGGKLVVFELDTVDNNGGSYVHTTTASEAQHDMKAVAIEVSNPAAFMSDISITTADGSITLSCDDVNGTSDVTVSCLFIANASAITSSEFDVLSNRIGSLNHLDTTVKTDLVSAVNELDGRINSLWETIYPVGSIYMSATSTSPSVLFGGTWEQLKDAFLLGAGDTYTAGDVGGSATKSYTPAGTVGSHTLTVAEIPSHNHTFTGTAVTSGNNSVGHTHTLNGHVHSVGAHAHGLNSHTHSVGAHAHGLNGHVHSGPSHAHAGRLTVASSGSISNGASKLFQNGSKIGAGGNNANTNVGINSGQDFSNSSIDAAGTGNTGGNSGSTANSGAFNSGGPSTTNTANSSAFNSGGNSGNTSGISANHTHSVTASGTIGNKGDGGGHNHGFTGTAATIDVLPPYLTVYMWKRTA